MNRLLILIPLLVGSFALGGVLHDVGPHHDDDEASCSFCVTVKAAPTVTGITATPVEVADLLELPPATQYVVPTPLQPRLTRGPPSRIG